MKNMIVLPLSGDLWVAPEYDDKGEIKPRADNVDLGNLPPRAASMTSDQMAMLMAQIQQAKPAAQPE